MKENNYIDEIIDLYKTKDFNEAHSKINDQILLDRNNASLFNLKAIVYRAEREYEKSLVNYNKAILLDKRNPSFLNNRGNLYRDLGNIEKAINDYNKALQMDPNFFDAIINLIKLKQEEGHFQESEKLSHKAIQIEGNRSEGYNLLAIAQLNQNQNEDAIKNFETSLDIKFDKLIEHQLAILKVKQVKTTPIEYIENVFDGYSKNFDNHLINKLDYKLPNLINKKIKENINKEKFTSTLDMGCGTGLCGEFLKDVSKKITGIDISSKMLNQAEQKNIYNALIKSDFINFLDETNNKYDLFIASDVFIYTGNIDETFRLVKRKSKLEAFFIFSIELCEGKKYKFLETGRFAHSDYYIKKKCEDNLFQILDSEIIDIRKQNDEWIKGKLYIVRI